jgi:hypothetical protein
MESNQDIRGSLPRRLAVAITKFHRFYYKLNYLAS